MYSIYLNTLPHSLDQHTFSVILNKEKQFLETDIIKQNIQHLELLNILARGTKWKHVHKEYMDGESCNKRLQDRVEQEQNTSKRMRQLNKEVLLWAKIWAKRLGSD
uniref:Uncharacterized protein n=1 Tax=Sphaerodactylus townsendi TaxID=933632 RepID=A0ACB8FZ58_9SAUR